MGAQESGQLAIARVNLVLDGRLTAPRVIGFRRLADGSWASDALLAVRHGRQGEKVYAEAIHLPSSAAADLRSDLITAEVKHVRRLYSRRAEILGWAARAGFPFGLRITASPSHCDEDYVSG